MYTMDRPGSWSDRGSAEILLDPIHNKFQSNFSRVAAREWVSFTRRNDARSAPFEAKIRLICRARIAGG